jgi:hypothetical protein
MMTDLARTIAEAYRWQRRLGNAQIVAPHCHIVADPVHPNVWIRTMPTTLRRRPAPDRCRVRCDGTASR